MLTGSNAHSLGASRPDVPPVRAALRKSRRIIVTLRIGGRRMPCGPRPWLLQLQIMSDRDELLTIPVARRPIPDGGGDRTMIAPAQLQPNVGRDLQRPAQDDRPATVLPASMGRGHLRDARAERQAAKPLGLEVTAGQDMARVGALIAGCPGGEELPRLAIRGMGE